MKRSHRRFHRLVWPLVVLGAGAVIGLALLDPWPSPENAHWPRLLPAASP